MRIRDIAEFLEGRAPRSLQESYDNVGLQVGDPDAQVDRVLVCLDCTEAVVEEAAAKGCGLVISHHPVIFKGLKALTGSDHVQRTVMAALRHGIALYAIHTNLDNVIEGVNGEIARRLGLKPLHVLEPKAGQLRKLVVFVPLDHADAVRDALYRAGAGHVGNYDECSFTVGGMGTFRPGPGSDPFTGEQGRRELVSEFRIEVIYPVAKERAILNAMYGAHPYEEVAHDLVPLENRHPGVGSGLVGEWEEPLDEPGFLARLKEVFKVPVVRHSPLVGSPVRRVAVCGGSGAFLIGSARAAGADAFITGDVKYHDFFLAEGDLLLADVGHHGSEQYTIQLVQRWLGEKFPTFAVLSTETVTDPIHYS